MKHILTFGKFCAVAAAVCLILPPSASAAKKQETAELRAPKNEYLFKTRQTPVGFATLSTAAFPFYGTEVMTMQDRHIADVKKNIVQVVFNPSGINFGAIALDKKGVPEATVYDPRNIDDRLTAFSNKKLGAPRAFAFTPDARIMILATDNGINLINQKDFKVTETFKTAFTPVAMVMSPNGYYLAATDGRNVEVINFEERKSRKLWKFDEIVNGVFFSEDSSMLGVLSSDGLLDIYNTRDFTLKTTVDDLGQALAGAFNFDGKYVAVATSPSTIEVINLLRQSERETVDVPDGVLTDLVFLADSRRQTLLTFNTAQGIGARRMIGLEPYYGKLMADEVAGRMNDWLKMMPGESMEDYQARVNDKTRAAQQRLFEDEISTDMANNLLSMSAVTLGKYDRANQLLEVDFSNMPSILLPVPENDLANFTSGDDLEFSEAKYGIMPNDNFELIYAKVYNKANGKSYLFDNLERRPLSFMDGDDNVVSLELIQQQQMEEIRLEEIRKEVVEQAQSHNVISEHTNIAVNSRVYPDYNANGDRITNYEVGFTYEVEPEFSATEDFGPGKYHIDESGAASSMLAIVKEAFEGDFSQYVKDGKKLRVRISGTADATPIIRTIAYDGSYGDFVDEPVRQNGQLSAITVTQKDGVRENPQLAFLRASAVRDYLEKNVKNLDTMKSDYEYVIDVSEDRGSAFRRITVVFTFVDAY